MDGIVKGLKKSIIFYFTPLRSICEYDKLLVFLSEEGL